MDQTPVGLLPALAPIFHVLESIEDAIRAADARIKALVKKYPDVEVVSQPVGVGVLTGLAFILTIEDKHRFRNSRSVGAFFGMCPRKRASGRSDPQLRITKAGDPFVRRLLIQGANYLLGKKCRAQSDMRSWGLELSERGGMNAKKRATVAVARRTAVLMHRLWMTGEEYDPHRLSRKAG
jgi:transposase